jgi:hypothetical protein
MKTAKTLAAMAALTSAIAFAAACSKGETAAPTAGESSASSATAASELTSTAPSTTDAPEPTPGSSEATFTPASDTPAPMLPTLGAAPAAAAHDEHSQSPAKAAVRRIAPEEAAMLVQTGEAILLDVRIKEAFDTEHIKGAVNIPYADIESRARAELTPTRWIIPYCT